MGLVSYLYNHHSALGQEVYTRIYNTVVCGKGTIQTITHLSLSPYLQVYSVARALYKQLPNSLSHLWLALRIGVGLGQRASHTSQSLDYVEGSGGIPKPLLEFHQNKSNSRRVTSISLVTHDS